jgi:hypothetical protein
MKFIFLLWLILTFSVPLWVLLTGKVDLKADYSTANRDSAHLAPTPEGTPEAVIQVYAARAFNWRGAIASHSWIATKPKNAKEYTVYQVVGWRQYRGLPALSIAQDLPDRNWYNEKPEVLLDIRGSKAEALIPRIDQLAKTYPYAVPYTLWPGPNSNTFPAYIARNIPELGLAMPANAIGKDFLPGWQIIAKAPSGTGYQFSLFGVFGLLVAEKEGVEINFLGLTYGAQLNPSFRILLPGLRY